MYLFFPEALLANGYCHCHRLCLCVCVSVCLSTFLVRAITHHTFQLKSPDLDEKMQNILLKVPIVLGGWISLTFHVKFNFISKFCLFALLLRLWNICETCKNGVCWTIPHRIWRRTHSDSFICTPTGSCHRPWKSNNKSSGDHRSPASPRLGDWQWIFQAAVGFHQIIHTSYINILYYNIGNHWNNCKPAVICPYLSGSDTLR